MTFWIFYVLAQAIHVLSKAYFVIRSAQSGITTYAQYVRVNAVPVLVRFAFATAFFVWWFNDPALVDKFFDVVGGQFAPGFLHDLIVGVHFPLNAGTALLYGLAVDSALDKVVSLIPWLRRDVPPIAGDVLS